MNINSMTAWELGYEAEFAGDLFPSIVWRSDATNYLQSTSEQIESLQAQIDNSPFILPNDFLTGWQTFKTQWEGFKKDSTDGIHIFDSASIMDSTDVYVQRLKAYQTTLQKLGVAKNAPEIVTDPDSHFAPKTGLSTLQLAGVGLAIGVAGIIVAKVVL